MKSRTPLEKKIFFSFKTNITFLFLVSMSIILTNCEIEIDALDPCKTAYKEMPNHSESGQRKFGCYIDGQEWVARTGALNNLLGGTPTFEANYNERFYTLRLYANRYIFEEDCDTVNQTFIIRLNDVTGEGTYEWQENSYYRDQIKNEHYEIGENGIGEVTITKLDTFENIVSGTFNATLINNNESDTLSVFDGRFDEKY